MIPSPVREALLQIIVQDWRAMEPQWRPDRMWIREYAATNATGDGIPDGLWPNNFWVLGTDGLQEQCVIQWKRLESIHFGFATPMLTRKMDEDGRPANYESGLASFAPLPESGWYYCEYVYSPAWSRGCAVHIDADGTVLETRGLWLS
jgi:hypothetical protein